MLDLIERHAADGSVCYVFLDREESGFYGSKAHFSMYRPMLTVNLDVIGRRGESGLPQQRYGNGRRIFPDSVTQEEKKSAIIYTTCIMSERRTGCRKTIAEWKRKS